MISIRSGFDADKIIAQDQARQAEERKAAEAAARQKEIEKRKGRKKGTPAAPATPPAPSVITAPYKGIQFEPLAYHAVDQDGKLQTEKALLTYDQSLEGLQQRGFERHPSPAEVFGLLADNLENRLTGSLKTVADDMLTSYGEWLDMAVERKGDILLAYFGVSGLRWAKDKYVKDNFRAAKQREFDIAGIPSSQYVDLAQFPDEFTHAAYRRAFAALPLEMQKGDRRAQVYLRETGIWPIGHGDFGRFDASAVYLNRASRGVRQAPKSP